MAALCDQAMGTSDMLSALKLIFIAIVVATLSGCNVHGVHGQSFLD